MGWTIFSEGIMASRGTLALMSAAILSNITVAGKIPSLFLRTLSLRGLPLDNLECLLLFQFIYKNTYLLFDFQTLVELLYLAT